MKSFLRFLGSRLLYVGLGVLTAQAGPLPSFSGKTDGVLRQITLPTVDLSPQAERQTVIARGTAETYHGHCDTVLLPDGKTMFAAWSVGHAQVVGPLARSEDAGKTWSAPLTVPANWHTTANTPALHRLLDPKGVARLVIFANGLDWRRGGMPPYPRDFRPLRKGRQHAHPVPGLHPWRLEDHSSPRDRFLSDVLQCTVGIPDYQRGL